MSNLQVMSKSEHKKLHMNGENHPRGMLNKNHSEKSLELMRENNKGENNPMYDVHKYGEESPNHKLITQDVIEIRIDLKEGLLTQREIAKKFGVSPQTISFIKLEKIWNHIK